MRRTPDMLRAARLAYRVLAAQEISTLPVDPLRLLRSCRDTAVFTSADAADILNIKEAKLDRLFAVSEAVTFLDTGEGAARYIVLYRPGGNPARLRFTLAHELGHRVLGHRTREPADEREADCFASHLLCPQPVLTCVDTPGELATACYVSLSCAKAAFRRVAYREEGDALRRVEQLLSGSGFGGTPPKDE